MNDLRQELGSMVGRVKAYVADQAKRQPQARVRLSRPLSQGAIPEALASGPKKAWAFEGDPGQPSPPWAPDLDAFNAQIRACQRCSLGSTRKAFVYGEGDPRAELVFVGEAPGSEEDAQGRPFVGPAGKLLDKIIAAMGRRRSQVYLLNLLKCRPPGSRDPHKDEIDQCKPYLDHQLGLLKPRVIVALGGFAANAMLGAEHPITAIRGRFFDAHGAKLLPTFPPAAVIKDPSLKRHVWDDMKLVVAYLQEHP